MSQMNHPQIAARVFGQPLLLDPGYARVFFSALAPRLNIGRLVDTDGQALEVGEMQELASGWDSGRERDRPYQVVDGIAVLPISGTLVHKYGYLKPYSGMTGYDGIIARAADAFGDPEIRGVLLDQDTPGGEAAGCFDCAQTLRKMADQAGKPLWSLCYDLATSAGMAMASAAHHRLITQSGRTGSVGVVMAHHSLEKNLEEKGIEVTLIHSGDRKVDGNPYQNLPDDVLERFQASIDKSRQEFAQLVAGHIGLDVDSVLATEAAIYRGQEAIDVGFADELVNGFEAVPAFLEHLSSQGRTISVGMNMTDKTKAPAGAETETEGAAFTQADVDKARADGAASERERIAAITGSEEAEGRQDLAQHFAHKTNMSADDAIAAMAASPKQPEQQAEAPADPLGAAMAETEQPNASAESGDGDEAANISEADAMCAAFDKMNGKGAR